MSTFRESQNTDLWPDNRLQNQTEGEALAGFGNLKREDRGSEPELVGGGLENHELHWKVY